MNFMLRQFDEDTLVNMLSSPLVRVRVERAIEPSPEQIPYSIQDKILQDLQNLQVGIVDHNNLSSESRNKPNQHTIDSISNLRRKVEVHVGPDEPLNPSDTWLDVVEIDADVSVQGNWEILRSTPVIFFHSFITTMNFNSSEARKLVVVGDLAGEIYRQELHSNVNGQISGEVIIYLSEDYSQVASVQLTVEASGGNSYFVTEFTNTGNIIISDFTALSIEVYR